MALVKHFYQHFSSFLLTSKLYSHNFLWKYFSKSLSLLTFLVFNNTVRSFIPILTPSSEAHPKLRQTIKMECFAKFVNYFCKMVHRCLTGCWMRICSSQCCLNINDMRFHVQTILKEKKQVIVFFKNLERNQINFFKSQVAIEDWVHKHCSVFKNKLSFESDYVQYELKYR